MDHSATIHSSYLERFGLTECKTNKVPLSPSAAAVLQKGTEQDVNKARDLPYPELMGCLQYLAPMTRPDICFAVNRLSSYSSAWTKRHFELAKGILRYVAGNRNHGLQLCTSNSGLEGFVDSDYNACLDDRTSTSGWLVKYRGGVIAWRSRKPKIVSHSTAESECIAIDDIAKDLVWERRALSVSGDKQSNETSTKLNVDNKAAILMSRNRTNHDSTKHIDSRYHYIRDLVSSSIINPVYIDTNENTADILTKALPRDKFEYHLEGLGVVEPPMLIQVGESVEVRKSG